MVTKQLYCNGFMVCKDCPEMAIFKFVVNILPTGSTVKHWGRVDERIEDKKSAVSGVSESCNGERRRSSRPVQMMLSNGVRRRQAEY